MLHPKLESSKPDATHKEIAPGGRQLHLVPVSLRTHTSGYITTQRKIRQPIFSMVEICENAENLDKCRETPLSQAKDLFLTFRGFFY
jgi:hypothetical protein